VALVEEKEYTGLNLSGHVQNNSSGGTVVNIAAIGALANPNSGVPVVVAVGATAGNTLSSNISPEKKIRRNFT